MLSPQLLELLREWWKQCRSPGWLFPGRDPLLPITVRQLNRACHMAADAAGLGSSPIYPAIAGGAPIRMTGSFMPGFFYYFYARPNIADWPQLEGKRVGGGAPGALLHELARLVVEAKGLDFEKIQYVNVGGSPDVYRAVTADKIDAGVSGIEFSREAEQTGEAKALGDLNELLPNYLRYCEAASERTLKDKADAYTAFFYGQMQGHRHALTNKQDTLALATKITQRDSSELGWAIDYYVNKKTANPNGDVSSAKIDYMVDLNVRLGNMKEKIPASRVLDDTIQQKVLAMLGRV